MSLHPLRRPHRQRGAILIMTAAFIVAAVALLALAVDTGRLYAAQQKLQSAANLAALDAARAASGCRADLGNASGLAAAEASIASNFAGRDGDTRPAVSRYDEGLVTTNEATGLREFAATPDVTTRPNGVRLTVTDDSYQPLFSIFADNDTTLSASAGSISFPTAQIGIGTKLAGINPNLLSDLLPIEVGAAQTGDLALLNVSLADLLDLETGVATREQLLDVSLNEALENLSDLVSNSAAGLVDDIAQLFPTDAGQASLLSILDIAGPIGTDLRLNAGQIVNAAAQLAASQRDTAITLDTDGLSVPGIADIDVDARILEPGTISAGPAGRRGNGGFRTEAKSAQIALGVRITLADINIGILRLTLLDLPLIIQAAPGVAGLERIDCPSVDDNVARVAIDSRASALRATVGEFADTDGDGDMDVRRTQVGLIDNVELIGLPVDNPVISVEGDAELFREGGTQTFEVRDIEQDLPSTPVEVGTNLGTRELLQGLLSDVDLDVDIVGLNVLPLNVLLAPINNLLSGPLATLLAPLLDPLLDGLGVSLGNAEVQLIDLDVDQPELFCASRSDCGFEAEDGG